MRAVSIAGMLLCFCLAGQGLAQAPQRMSLEGSWTFIWDNDAKNTNTSALKQGAGTFTGTYVNDAKDQCPVAGRMTSASAIALTIVCPKWEIRAEGSITNAQLVVGNYVAYGSSKGTFRMSRQ